MSLDSILSRAHLPALDGLRVVAVALVIASHAGLAAVPADLGVTLFFVLSGFLITWLLLAEIERTGRVSLRAFYRRRTFRIFPAYYAMIVGTLLAHRVLLDREWTAAQVWTSLLYLVDVYIPWVDALSHPVNHAWSLAIEEQFYLLWPLVFIAVSARGRRTLVWTAGGAIIAALVLRTVGVAIFEWSYFTTAFSFWTRFDSLMAGCLLAILLSSVPMRARLARLGAAPWYALVTAGAIACSRLATPLAYRQTVGYTIDSLLIAVLLVQLLVVHHTAMWRWLDWRPIAWTGRTLTYSLYLWHSWGLALGARLPLPTWAQVAGGVALAVGLALGSYYVVERPFLAFKTARPRRRRSEPALAA